MTALEELRELADALDKAEAADAASWSTTDWYRAQAARAAYVAAARTAVPALLDALEEARGLLEDAAQIDPWNDLGFDVKPIHAFLDRQSASFGVPEETQK